MKYRIIAVHSVIIPGKIRYEYQELKKLKNRFWGYTDYWEYLGHFDSMELLESFAKIRHRTHAEPKKDIIMEGDTSDFSLSSTEIKPTVIADTVPPVKKNYGVTHTTWIEP